MLRQQLFICHWLLVSAVARQAFAAPQPTAGATQPPQTAPLVSCCFYVDAAHGSDANGTSGGEADPFRTLGHALEATRRSQPAPRRVPCAIVVQAGTHRLTPGAPLVLGPADSNLTIKAAGVDASPTVVSGGVPVNDSCWRAEQMLGSSQVYACRLPPSIARFAARMRTLRVSPGALGPSAREPDFAPESPYTGGWLTVNSSHMTERNRFIVGVAASSLSPAVLDPAWAGGMAEIFPTHSWVNVRHVAVSHLPSTEYTRHPALAAEALASGLRHLVFTCPEGGYAASGCTNTSLSAAIGPGNRFYLYGYKAALSQVGEWHFDSSDNATLRVVSQPGQPPVGVTVPTVTEAIQLRGRLGPQGSLSLLASDVVRGVLISGLTFRDVDYERYGYQEGWNILPGQGMPDDASIKVSGASDTVVDDCHFDAVAGGGVHVANGSTRVIVQRSSFHQTGQSGVIFTGNTTSQPSWCKVLNCTVANPGSILASAGGVVINTASFTTVSGNNISDSSRWGIAARSNGPHAFSQNNSITSNRIFRSGQKTRDMGALSVIGVGETGTVISGNCVCEVIGTDTNDKGEFLRPFYTFGMYMDNWASGFHVTNNVFRTMALSGVFVHGGSHNVVTNNVIFNVTSNGPQRGKWGYSTGGDFWIGQMRNSAPPQGNKISGNIVYSLDSHPSQHLIGNTTLWNPDLAQIDGNCYYNSAISFNSSLLSRLTPEGDFASWIKYSGGQDEHSVIADPLFADVSSGDFALRPGSPALALGFQPLPRTAATDCV